MRSPSACSVGAAQAHIHPGAAQAHVHQGAIQVNVEMVRINVLGRRSLLAALVATAIAVLTALFVRVPWVEATTDVFANVTSVAHSTLILKSPFSRQCLYKKEIQTKFMNCK